MIFQPHSVVMANPDNDWELHIVSPRIWHLLDAIRFPRAGRHYSVYAVAKEQQSIAIPPGVLDGDLESLLAHTSEFQDLVIKLEQIEQENNGLPPAGR